MNFAEVFSGIYRSEAFGPSVVAAFSGRKYDNSKRGEYLQALSLNFENLVMTKQVHGSKILTVTHVDASHHETPADGLITDKKGIVLGVRTADCVPIFFHDPIKKAIGVAHGGWKGVRNGIVGEMLNSFEREFGTKLKDLQVALGPAIRACCYEVGSEFSSYFPGFYKAKSEDKGYLDLAGVIRQQLSERGVQSEHIDDTQLCTVCQNESFFSYRVESQTKERILSVMSIFPG